jgi:aminopeptidase N
MFQRLHRVTAGCVRLHTLKYLMGEERFWPALAAYVAEHSGKTV